MLLTVAGSEYAKCFSAFEALFIDYACIGHDNDSENERSGLRSIEWDLF